jgi:protein-tyrosine-phosphatase
VSARIYNVLFLCTGNSARSILAEVALNELGNGRFQAFSAGSQPVGRVNLVAIETLVSLGWPTQGLRSKNWEEFARPEAPPIDFIITVCDNAANEVCPVWPGKPITAHWGVPDPAAVEGSDAAKRKAFVDVLVVLRRRIELLVSLPHATLDGLLIHEDLKQIGKA